MPCYHPLTGYYARKINDSGKRSLVFDVEKALLPEPIQIACGRCIGCRLDRSLSWALRCTHEASLYEDNCFITLTFNDLNIKASLDVSDFQNFMKRLRKKIAPHKVRFFHCGEYGEQFSRPHHHACLFGFDFPDKILFNNNGKSKTYTSEMLAELWPYGFHSIGEVTFDSAAYVARYVLKKWNKDEDNLKGEALYKAMRGFSDGKFREEYYHGLKEEYVTMSRKPGIGEEWYKQFYKDIYSVGGFALTPNFKKVKPPRYYDQMFEITYPMEHSKIKCFRLDRAQCDQDNIPQRLQIREKVKLITINNQLKRGFENGSQSVFDLR